MENLTLTMKIAKPHTIDPLEGHTVVIFEQVGTSGEEYRFEIAPGQTAPTGKRTIFEVIRGKKPPTYFAYAVTGLPELRWKFPADVTLDIQTHSFTLLVTLAYSVGEPRMLVTRRNDDPIRKVREQVASLLVRQFAQRTWREVLGDFRGIERVVVASIVPLAQQYAMNFGINVHDVELNHQLTDADIKSILADETAENDHKRAMRDRQWVVDDRAQEQKIRNFELEDKVNVAIADAAINGIKNIGLGIQSPADYDGFRNMQGGGSRSAIEGGRSNARHLIAEGENGQSGAAGVIAEAFERTESMGLPRSQKQRLQSAILHVVAEIILDGEGADAEIEKYVAQVDEVRHEPKLSMADADYLKHFVDFEKLRDILR